MRNSFIKVVTSGQKKRALRALRGFEDGDGNGRTEGDIYAYYFYHISISTHYYGLYIAVIIALCGPFILHFCAEKIIKSTPRVHRIQEKTAGTFKIEKLYICGFEFFALSLLT